MLKIEQNKIIKKYNKIPYTHYIKQYYDNTFNDYLLNYIDYIYIKNILKNATFINIIEKDIDLTQFIDKKYLANDLTLIGSGAYGSVYKLLNNKCVKIETISEYKIYYIEQKLREYKISKICGEKNIGPKVYKNNIIYNIFNSNIYFFTYMEYIEGKTYYKYTIENNPIDKNLNKIKNIFNKKIKLLHTLGFIHYDIHSNNIIIKLKNKEIIDVYIIDYGLSQKIDNMNSITMYENIYAKNNYKLDYFIKNKNIVVNINKKLTTKIKIIYNNIIKKNIILNKDINLNNIYNVNMLSDIIYSIIYNNINSKIVNIKKIKDFIDKKYNVKRYNFENINEYPFFNLSHKLFNIISFTSKNNNKYLCLIYEKQYFKYYLENIDNEILISKKLCKNNISLNIKKIDLKKFNNNTYLCVYIKLDKTKYNNFVLMENISKKDKINYYINSLKKIIDLNLNFEYINYTGFIKRSFIYNDKIYFFNLFDMSINKYKNNYNEKSNELTNFQKIQFIKKLIEKKILLF